MMFIKRKVNDGTIICNRIEVIEPHDFRVYNWSYNFQIIDSTYVRPLGFQTSLPF